MSSKKRIFISPLDWGLGHATRCIPIIKELIKQGAEVIIGADRKTFHLLRKEFPKELFIKFPGYHIQYSKKGNMVWQMAKMSPKIIGRVSIENKYLEEIIKTHNIDGVISDNRYGLYNEYIPTVFITHQLHIKSPIGKRIIKAVNKFFIQKFDFCWVPDYEDEKIALSGELSHHGILTDNIQYIGPLSRFNHNDEPLTKKYDLLAIISGPEPQRTIFEEMTLSQLEKTNLKALVVLGKPNDPETKSIKNIHIINHLESNALEQAIRNTELILSRPGYSTIMDLAAIGKKAIFIPTPGQTEQKYLAKHHEKLGNCVAAKQKDFDLEKLIEQSKKIAGFKPHKGFNQVEKCVAEFLDKVKKR